MEHVVIAVMLAAVCAGLLGNIVYQIVRTKP